MARGGGRGASDLCWLVYLGRCQRRALLGGLLLAKHVHLHLHLLLLLLLHLHLLLNLLLHLLLLLLLLLLHLLHLLHLLLHLLLLLLLLLCKGVGVGLSLFVELLLGWQLLQHLLLLCE